jgi:hypothetical protein
MDDGTIPQEKSPKRLISMSLPVDLVEALEEMAESHDKLWGVDLHTMIRKSLKWAVWAHSNRRGPDAEMAGEGGYTKWNEKIRERRDVAELKRLFTL